METTKVSLEAVAIFRVPMVRIHRNTLRRHFEKELQTGATKLNAKVGHFMVTTIFGTRPPDGFTPIRDERVRGRLGELFLKSRLGWRDGLNQHKSREEERPIDLDEARRRNLAMIAEVSRRLGADPGEPTET